MWSKSKSDLNYHDQLDRSITKGKQDNDVSDSTGVIVAKYDKQ